MIDSFENGVGPSLEPVEENTAPINPFDFIGDVKERATKAPTAPQPPSLQNARGFPTHRKRNVQSRFKKSRQDDQNQDAASVSISNTGTTGSSRPGEDDFMTSERHRIDEENRQRLAEMSQEEIDEERADLLKSLDPGLLQRLMNRANTAIIDEGGSNADFPGLEKEKEQQKQESSPEKTKPRKSVKFAETVETSDNAAEEERPTGGEALPEDVDNEIIGNIAAAEESLPFDSSIHFPQPPQPPSLDPSSPNFLNDLHEKYFPSLPEDPEKLEWMRAAPVSTYSASQTSFDPKDIRFDFTGALIPPKRAAEIPVTLGLHHHGDSPDTAGYTIPELATLARSSVAAQRCVAFQTLGRLLYRLGKGEMGNPGDGSQGTVGEEDTLGGLARALWSEVEKEKIIEICITESEGKIAGGRHVSARSFATEAIWLWQKGGGRRWKAT